MSLPKLFENVRPGAPNRADRDNVPNSLDIIDAERHPLTYAYATYSDRWSASTLGRWVSLWNDGYQRFGDEFEAALATRTEKTQKPTELAKTLVTNLADPWMLIGHLFREFTPDEQYWWSRCLSKDYDNFLLLMLKTSVPDRRLADWVGYKLRYGSFYAKFDNPESWAKAIHVTVVERYGHTTVSTISREPLLEAVTIEFLTAIVDGGVTPEQYAAAVKGKTWSMNGLRMYLTEGIPMEYALAL